MSSGEPALSEVLQSWMHRDRRRPGELAEAAGITRYHLHMLRMGRIKRPATEVLRRLARAFATNPDGAHDEGKERAALRELGDAAGHGDLSLVPEPGSLDAALIATGVDNPQARAFYRELISHHPQPSPLHQELIRALLDRLGGSDAARDLQGLLDRYRCLPAAW